METVELFKKFKAITQEENKIINLIKENLEIGESTTILDIGSNIGLISQCLQKNKKGITLVDTDEFDIENSVKFIKSKWEHVEIDKKFEIILASHVWGHFGYTNTQTTALSKMLEHKEKEGHIILCYNVNSGFMKKLIKFSKNKIKDFQYDYFDESLIKSMKRKEIEFKVELRATSFEELTDLVKILIITDEKKHSQVKSSMREFLSKNLKEPRFWIEQKLAII